MAHGIVLIYDRDCPNVLATRKNLRDAIAASGPDLRWQEIDRADPAAPAKYTRFGSPTILINGHDVAGVAPSAGGDCCRVYPSTDGRFLGAPSVEQIRAALGSVSQNTGGGWRSLVLAIPAVAAGLLPSAACPACWPAYAAFLGTIGVGFIPTERLLLPLTIAALLLVLAAFGWTAVRSRRYGAAILGGTAAGLLVVGRFVWPAPPLQYAGVLGLVAASIWNIRLKRKTPAQGACPACPPVVPQK